MVMLPMMLTTPGKDTVVKLEQPETVTVPPKNSNDGREIEVSDAIELKAAVLNAKRKLGINSDVKPASCIVSAPPES